MLLLRLLPTNYNNKPVQSDGVNVTKVIVYGLLFDKVCSLSGQLLMSEGERREGNGKSIGGGGGGGDHVVISIVL